MKHCLQKGLRIDELRDHRGRPPLHAAIVANADFPIARLLVAHAPGAVEQLDADGRSPIMLCLTPPDELGYPVGPAAGGGPARPRA